MELHFGLFISSSSLLTIPSLLKPFWLQGSESGGVVATLRTKSGYHQHYEVSPPLSVGATLTSHYSSATPGWSATDTARKRGLELVRRTQRGDALLRNRHGDVPPEEELATSHSWTGGRRKRLADEPHRNRRGDAPLEVQDARLRPNPGWVIHRVRMAGDSGTTDTRGSSLTRQGFRTHGAPHVSVAGQLLIRIFRHLMIRNPQDSRIA